MDIYADNILDHFRHPRHHGELNDATLEHEERNVECGDVVQVWLKLDPLPTHAPEGHAREGVGEWVVEDSRGAAWPTVRGSAKAPAGATGVGPWGSTLPLAGGGNKGGGSAFRIAEIGWTGTGCAISQASMSILSEEIEGKSEGDIQAMSKDDVYVLLGVPIGPRRFKCALMGLHAVKNALRKAKGLALQDWVATVSLGEG